MSPTSQTGADQASLLATDLDGTLIPLEGSPRNVEDLSTLSDRIASCGVMLVFITGRHLASVRDAMGRHALPPPAWLVCDVGSSIFQRTADGNWHRVDAYREQLDRIVDPLPIDELRAALAPISTLRLQEEEKQGLFKLSYYTDASELRQTVDQVRQVLLAEAAPYSVIDSVDPFNGDGLVDLLPAEVSKAYALRWLVQHLQRHPESVVFAGDSGNDLAALTAGYRSIVVGNADRSVAEAAVAAHREANWQGRLCLAEGHATTGVLEGCRHFGLFDEC